MVCSPKTGLDIVCDNTDAKHIFNALDILKKNSYPIYWMKFRSCSVPRIKDYIFLGLNVKHLNIIRSNVSVIDRSSLSALGETLTDLDLSNNNIHEVGSLIARSSYCRFQPQADKNHFAPRRARGDPVNIFGHVANQTTTFL